MEIFPAVDACSQLIEVHRTPEERILAAMELQKLAEEVRRAGREARRSR